MLEEIHQGVCGSHLSHRALCRKTVLQGYYWPSIGKDAEKLVQDCENCQKYSNYIHSPAVSQNPLISPWPFAVWGIDLQGAFPKATGQRQWIVIAVDHFTKWAEAESLASITDHKMIDFVFHNIVCRFGVPHTIVSNNGAQFISKRF